METLSHPSDINCPRCGAAVPSDAPEGFCLVCLLREGVLRRQTALSLTRPPDQIGDYEIVEEIARGGMGVVYRARQVSLNRAVALKMILKSELASEESRQRFVLEAKAAAALDHPDSVPIYEVGEWEGLPFFTMKLMEGGTLASRLSQCRICYPANPRCLCPPGRCTLDVRNASHWLEQIARAVQYAHQRGVLHRDLKPSNILLDANGHPHLTDFGLARLVEKDSTLTRTMAMLGTPSYMSPEQARGEAKQLTTAVDVYGLGAIFYELLTGLPPFTGGTTMETFRQVLENEPRPRSAIRAGTDRDLETICLKCLEKEPSARYASAEALAQDLGRWRRKEPIQARPATPTQRFGKWVRRNPRIAGLTTLLLLAFAAGIGG